MGNGGRFGEVMLLVWVEETADKKLTTAKIKKTSSISKLAATLGDSANLEHLSIERTDKKLNDHKNQV